MDLHVINKLKNNESKITIDLKHPTFDRKGKIEGIIIEHDDMFIILQLSEGSKDRKKEIVIPLNNINGITEYNKYTKFYDEVKDS